MSPTPVPVNPEVTNPETVRAPIELTHAKLIDARKKKFTDDKRALETTFHTEMATLRTNRENALIAAGLNPDGTVAPPPAQTELTPYGG